MLKIRPSQSLLLEEKVSPQVTDEVALISAPVIASERSEPKNPFPKKLATHRVALISA